MNLVGAHLNGYLVRRALGAGAVGTVYLAEHRAAHRRVALKVLHRDREVDDLPVARWLAEARAAAALGHDHIVEVIDGGDAFVGDRRVAFLAMELLGGETLADRLRGGPLDEDEARHVGLQLCSALAACHASGIVHRYLTPANVHLCPRGGDPLFVKLTDFGIATLDDAALDLDAAADVHALGVLLHEMLTARRDRAAAPQSWSAVVMHCLEDDPRDRFATMDELADAIRDPQAHALAYAAAREARAMGFELARTRWSSELAERTRGHAAAGTPPPFAVAQLGVATAPPPPTTPLPIELLFPTRERAAARADRERAPEVRPDATPPAPQLAQPSPPTPRLTASPAEPTPRLRAESITGGFPPLRPRISRAWWLALAAAILLGGALIAGALHLHPGRRSACAVDEPSSVARGSAEATPAPEALQSFAIAPAPGAPADDAAPIRVTITSDPPSAHVHGADGEHVLDGVAPMVFERARDAAPLTVTLSLPGRASVTRTIAPVHDTEIVIVVPPARSARLSH